MTDGALRAELLCVDTATLPQLITLKYHSLGDAVADLGPVGQIREVFVGFQQYFVRRTRQ